jgi:hypothetical protein
VRIASAPLLALIAALVVAGCGGSGSSPTVTKTKTVTVTQPATGGGASPGSGPWKAWDAGIPGNSNFTCAVTPPAGVLRVWSWAPGTCHPRSGD